MRATGGRGGVECHWVVGMWNVESLARAFIKMFCRISTLTMKPLVATMESDRVQWHSLRQHLKPPTKSSVTVEKRQLSDQRKHRGKAMPDFRWRKKSPFFVRKREEDECSHPELSFRLRKYLCEGQTMPFEWTQESVC